MSERYEELASRARNQLQAGQILYLAPYEAPDLKPVEIILTKCRVIGFPETGAAAYAETESGGRITVSLDISAGRRIHLGAVEVDGQEEAWVFLSEQDFWDWREWYILSSQISLDESFDDEVGYNDSRANLNLCRLLKDVLIGRNMNYQNRSCEGCIHINNEASCQQCARNKTLGDHWEGQTSNHE